MTKDEEIYAIRFNKVVLKDDIHMITYTLGVPVFAQGTMVVPKSITLAKDKITTTFNDGTKHIIHYTEDVEIFIRTKETKKEDGGDTQTDSK